MCSRGAKYASGCKLPPPSRGLPYRVALEGLDRSVLTQLAHMDAHVCAAGGKRIVALPVDVESRRCGRRRREAESCDELLPVAV